MWLLGTRFNTDRPKDFKGHSLSVSDIVVLHQNGENTAHYVDRTGYRDVPEFLRGQVRQLTPDELMTGEQIIQSYPLCIQLKAYHSQF